VHNVSRENVSSVQRNLIFQLALGQVVSRMYHPIQFSSAFHSHLHIFIEVYCGQSSLAFELTTAVL